jgi:hypothetical protein
MFIYKKKKTLETVLRSLYDLLGPNICIHQPVTDETVEQHSAFLFEKLDLRHVESINLDDFEKYCLRVCIFLINSLFSFLFLFRMNN